MKTSDERKAELAAFKVGDRVRVMAATWLFAAGAESGEVVKIGRTRIHIRADINGVTYSMPPSAFKVMEAS